MWPAGVLTGPIEIDLEDSCPRTIEVLTESDTDVISTCQGPVPPEPDYWDCVLSDLEDEAFSALTFR